MYFAITMSNRLFHIFIPALMLATRVWGQSCAYNIPGYTVTHYTDENGLPQNSIKSICMDDEGYIWLGTEAGLVRYDGRRFRLFTKEEMGTRQSRISIMSRQIHTGQLYAIVENRQEANLRIQANRPVFLPINPYFGSEWASKLRGKPVASYLYSREDNFPPAEFEGEALVYVSRDTFYLISPSHIIYRTYRQVLWETDVVREMGHYYYWQKKKLFRYDTSGNFTEITAQGPKPALNIPRYRKLVWNLAENQTFIHTLDNELLLLEVNPVGNLVTRPLMKGLPPGFEIEKAFRIKKELVFMGSPENGLLVCRKKHFSSFGTDRPQTGSIYYALNTYGNTVVTDQMTAIRIDGKIDTLGKQKPYGYLGLTQARWGGDSLLYARGDRLMLFSMRQKRILKTLDIGNKITCLYVDPTGRTWLAARHSGIFLVDRRLNAKKQFTLPPMVYVNTMLMAGERLLMGCLTGLYTYHLPTRTFTDWLKTDRYNIRSIFRSGAGNFYFCTYGDGIFMAGKHGLTQLSPDRPGYLKMAHCILQDRIGRLWISTNKGLFTVPESEVVRFAQGEVPQINYHYFDKTNGFRTNEFNGGCQPCGISLPSGHFAFPSMNGVVVFHPDSVYFFHPTKAICADRISIDGQFLGMLTDTLRVERNFRELEIYLSLPYYGSPHNLQIIYTTDTTNPDSWTPVHSDRRVALTALPPGHSYISFRQKKMAGVGAFTYHTQVLYKPRAFWEYPLFWPAVLVLAIVLVFATVRWRTHALKIRNRKLAETVETARAELFVTIDSLTETTQKLEKKTRFQQWLTSSIVHDLRGPLRFINFYDGEIRKGEYETTHAQNEFLKSVYFSALKIYNYSDNLVQLLRIEQNTDFPPQKTDFHKLAEDKIEQFREQAAWNGNTMVLLPGSDPFLWVNTMALSIIIQNLLDNSVKNLKNGHIYLCLKNEGGHATISIRDEGLGLIPEQLRRFNNPDVKEISGAHSSGIGLWLVRSLVMQTGGTIRFENVENPRGLLVTLAWPQAPEKPA